MLKLVMRQIITESYINVKAIYVPAEYRGNFPDIGESFVIDADDMSYDVSMDRCYRIKLTDWFNKHKISEYDAIELSKDDRIDRYYMSHQRGNAKKWQSGLKSQTYKLTGKRLSKRQVETAALEYVRFWLKKNGTKVKDADGEGCDLITEDEHGENKHYIEVKGSSYEQSPIMIYESIFEYFRNEGLSLDNYFIYIVSDIASDPKLRIITPEIQKWQEKKIRVLENQSFKDAPPLSLARFKPEIEKKLNK